jgi:hypothetical protein
MQAHRKLLRLGTVLAVAGAASVAGLGAAVAAPGVSPATFSGSGGPGSTFTVAKTVTTPEIAPLADVYFLADTTGSMSDPIANVKANASTILSTIVGGTTDPKFGAGDYKDFPFDAYAFQNAAAVGSSTADVQTAINGWSAGGGNDGPEGQLYALHRIATDPSVGWRAGSSRFLVWFGDAPGHDPVCPGIWGGAFDITTSLVAAELAAAKITVIAISTPTGFPNALNDNGGSGFDYASVCGTPPTSTNQANIITAATGGTHLSAASSSDVANLILTALQSLPVTVTSTSTCDPGLSVAMAPASRSGTSGDVFTFSETIGVGGSASPGTLHCTVQFLLNGVAAPEFTQQVTIDVTAQAGDACGEVRGDGKLSTNRDFRYVFYNVKFEDGVVKPIAEISFADLQDRKHKVKFVSTSIEAQSLSGTRATLTGSGLVNGAPVTYTVVVTDGRRGTFSIELSNGYEASGRVAKGRGINIKTC